VDGFLLPISHSGSGGWSSVLIAIVAWQLWKVVVIACCQFRIVVVAGSR